MRRLVLALVATAMVVTASYAGRAPTRDKPASAPAAASVEVTSPTPSAPASTDTVPAELDRLIDVFERRTATSSDALDFRTLGGHYASRAAITSAVADHIAAAAAYAEAYRLAPTDRDVLVGYGAAAAAVHDFATAQHLAHLSLGQDPHNAAALVVAADASAELGDLEAAAEHLDVLEAQAPGHPAVLARLANLAHLTGKQDEAIELAAAARDAAVESGASGRQLAFYPLLQADLLLDAGRYDKATAAAREALALDEGYAVAHASIGRVLAHRDEFESALESYRRALEIQADPGWDAAAAELLTTLGDIEEATTHNQRAIAYLQAGDETIFGRSLATLYADLDRDPAEALRLARADIERRQDIHAYDNLAWALYRNGLLAEARTASDAAIATGAQDAGLLYHSGVISAALGDTARARDELGRLLATNPGFNPVHGRHAADLLASLTG